MLKTKLQIQERTEPFENKENESELVYINQKLYEEIEEWCLRNVSAITM